MSGGIFGSADQGQQTEGQHPTKGQEHPATFDKQAIQPKTATIAEAQSKSLNPWAQEAICKAIGGM